MAKTNSKLDIIYNAVFNGTATEEELNTYTQALIKQIPTALEQWRKSAEKAITGYGYKQWIGEAAETAVKEGIKRVKEGKTWEIDFFHALEEEAIKLIQYQESLYPAVEVLRREARYGIPGMPGVNEKRQEYADKKKEWKDAKTKSQHLHAW